MRMLRIPCSHIRITLMKKNYLKIGLIALVLAGMVAPLIGQAALIERKDTLESCLLKHDMTDILGPGYEQGKYVSVKSTVGLDLSGLNDNEELISAATVAVQKNIGIWGVKPYNLIFAAFKTASSNAIDADNGITVGEYKAMGPVKDAVVGAVEIIPVVGGYLATAVDTLMAWVMDNATKGVKIAGESKYAALSCLIDKVETIADWFFAVLIVIAGMMVLAGAFVFLTAAGSPDKLKTGRNILIWAGIGIALAFISKGITRIIVQMMS